MRQDELHSPFYFHQASCKMASSLDFSPLFQPLQIGAVTLRDRVLVSALTRNRALPTNVPNDLMVEYYKQRAESARLTVSEGILICQQGTEWPHAPGIWNQEQIEGWKKINDAIHEAGSKCFAQIWHLGRVSHPDAPEQIASGQPVYGPSAIAARGGKFRFLPGIPGYVTPTEIDDPMKLVALLKQAAINAKEAGFDGIEVHGASGYLIHEFLDSGSNLRTDKWGGSIENRSRFGLEVLNAVIEVWGVERVGIKLSPAGGYNDMGMPFAETLATFNYFIAEIDKLGLAYIVLQRYSAFLNPIIDGEHRAINHDVLATYGHLVRKSTLLANASFTFEEAAHCVAGGKVAGVFWGQSWVSHLDLAKRVENGKPVDTPIDMHTLYGNTAGITLDDQRVGYTDYPFAEYP
ncbi:hypothetical protein J3R30DRAFT_3513084 [Lentinula aciculospora]|uniref:NADH:flavin oxidoreductase/NADH oxidase N-terminal domain-containing protein n=1 Tax=Lentinula aciculospora TaxID=153920 RepID=A0A9W9DJ71_9AGAR|nr:hypothetical protein J3R30DRAFT_3513084 [Lentinula aciculospora]